MARHPKGIAVLLAFAVGVVPTTALAWKPFTHNYTGKQVLRRLNCAARTINIGGRVYRVIPEVAAAICAQRTAYNAGAVGPDGFPDLAYGQAVIHPVETGKWLTYLLAAAWSAQQDPAYAPEERQRILAFTYGFLTHAAGDVWGHTLVNEFAGGVFPSVQEVVTDPVGNLPLALRHAIVEAVVGDATPGFDGNPTERKAAPGGYGMGSGDRSTDASEGFLYDVPHKFLFRTLVSPGAPTPVPAARGGYVAARGPLVGEFLELRDHLREFAGGAGPAERAAAEYEERMARLRSIEQTCVTSSFFGFLKNFQRCVEELRQLGLDLVDLSGDGLKALIEGERDRLGRQVLGSYMAKWADAIDAGLAQWTGLGLATTQGLFDAQTHRQEQNAFCEELHVPEAGASEAARKACEDQVSIRETVKRRSSGFIGTHGVKMMGLPEETVRVLEILHEQEQRLLEVLALAGSPLRPLAENALILKERFDDLVNQAILDALGVDIEALSDMLRNPAPWMCRRQVDVTVRGVRVTVPLFADGDRAKLDAYLGLDASSHVVVPGVPQGCARFRDDVEFNPEAVGAIRNTILMGKLILLEPAELDRYLGAALGLAGLPAIRTYRSGDNIMTTSLGTSAPWLRLIDGDHAWRSDGRPIFEARSDEKTGGTGRFPIWESCVLRAAFRSAFEDWENGATRFPSLGDAASADPANPGHRCIEAQVAPPVTHSPPAPVTRPPALRVPGRMVASDTAPDARVLRKYDANGNGALDPDELARIRAALAKVR